MGGRFNTHSENSQVRRGSNSWLQISGLIWEKKLTNWNEIVQELIVRGMLESCKKVDVEEARCRKNT